MQTTNNLIRLGGLAAVTGGALWVAKVLHEMNDETAYPRDLTDHAFFVVPLLLLGGLAGLFALDKRGSGQEAQGGLVGLLLGGFGLVVISASFGLWTLGAVSDVLLGILLGMVPLALGLLALGSTFVESGVLGRAKALPLVLGLASILAGILPPWNVVGVAVWTLLGLGWAALGLVLLVEGRSPAGHAATGGPETNV